MKKLLLLILISLIPTAFAYDFKVLSWNVYMLPKPIKKSLQNTRTRIIPAQLKETDYDLIFMQEAFTSGFRGQVAKAMKKTHPHTYYLKLPSFPYPFFGSGLFVLSKFPLKLVDHLYFRSCTDADCLASKGAAMMEITLPGGQKIQVVNTHLQATQRAGSIRMKQLGQIRAMMAKRSDPQVPQFLIGDLNIDPNEPEFPLGLSLLGMDYARLTGPILWTTGRTNPCFKAGSSHQWVDHMWFDNYSGISTTDMRVRNFEFERNGKTCPSSDHHAVEAEFYF